MLDSSGYSLSFDHTAIIVLAAGGATRLPGKLTKPLPDGTCLLTRTMARFVIAAGTRQPCTFVLVVGKHARAIEAAVTPLSVRHAARALSKERGYQDDVLGKEGGYLDDALGKKGGYQDDALGKKGDYEDNALGKKGDYEDCTIVCVPNPQWGKGLSSSLRAGLHKAGLNDSFEAAFVTPADLPDLPSTVIQQARKRYHPKHAKVVVPIHTPYAECPENPSGNPTAEQQRAHGHTAEHRGQQGHPVLFGRSVWEQVCAAVTRDNGAGALLRQWMAADETVVSLPTQDRGIIHDIDTPTAFDAYAQSVLYSSSCPAASLP